MNTLPAAIAIALWAFVGIESATVPAGEIKNPQKNIRKSTIYGTLIAAAVYLIVSIMGMGILDQATLASSNAPLAEYNKQSNRWNMGWRFYCIWCHYLHTWSFFRLDINHRPGAHLALRRISFSQQCSRKYIQNILPRLPLLLLALLLLTSCWFLTTWVHKQCL